MGVEAAGRPLRKRMLRKRPVLSSLQQLRLRVSATTSPTTEFFSWIYSMNILCICVVHRPRLGSEFWWDGGELLWCLGWLPSAGQWAFAGHRLGHLHWIPAIQQVKPLKNTLMLHMTLFWNVFKVSSKYWLVWIFEYPVGMPLSLLIHWLLHYSTESSNTEGQPQQGQGKDCE